MKQLKDILYRVAIESVIGSTDCAVNKLEFDSRKVSRNDVFVAIRGTQSNGHDFIQKAIGLGATVIVCDALPQELHNGITYVQVLDTNSALATMSANYFNNPSTELKLVGVTGTNGKTTIASLLFQLFQKAGFKVGLLSTVTIRVNEIEYPATHTTPDSLTINRYLREMVEAGVDYCFMEVSSHGIHQKRTEGLLFAGGIFTNLSHDHLDYHATFAEYRDVKKQFFDQLPKTAFALTNLDDKNGPVMLQNTNARKKSYALKTYADYKAQILENQLSGLLLKINDQDVWVRLIGTFNAYNILAIYGTAIELGLEPLDALRWVSELESVSGRFQFIVSTNQKITAIVDYAHTPDALENVLQTINSIRTKNEQLITVVGCGGDRDKTKRPIMAQIAAQNSDKVILTSDNPRTEDPEQILREMEAGIEPQHYKKSMTISDRFQAIKTACQLAQANDIILVAGKGHETYQEIQRVRYEFDDMQHLKDLFIQLQK
ncbi:MAG: UDP-N-acetylmuramoyl-L-alanyl-D-glutamate--2,6-diaminopimelate ligase [Flavobacterium sp.]|nr:UDP-N-acetylmuramoyl-L-alanyl-D-glutamate--2,6-diaminopimelate ligase [Flavobacterium sp.]